MWLLLDWALQPVGLMSLLLLSTLLSTLWKNPAHRLPIYMLLLATGIFWLFSAPIFANAAVYRLENWRQNPVLCDTHDDARPIVVLGGGLDPYVDSDSAYEILDRDSQLRVNRAIDVATPNAQIFLLGGGSPTRNLAQLMSTLLIDRAIDESRITTEHKSRSTLENAQALARLLPAELVPSISLVTSALHVPRAAAVFEHHGYVVCHVKSDTQYSAAVFPVSVLPYLAGLSKSTQAMRELLALAVYKLRGYI